MDKSHSHLPTTPAAAPPAEGPTNASAEHRRTRAGAGEKRSEARYPVSAAAVVVEARSRTRLTGRATDLSLSGCYVDAINLFPAGTPLHLRLTSEGHSFECEARVTYSLPGMGMGLAFTRVSANESEKLRNWISELSGEASAAPSSVPEIDFDPPRSNAATGANSGGWQDAFSELLTLLERRGVVSEGEATGLRSKFAR